MPRSSRKVAPSEVVERPARMFSAWETAVTKMAALPGRMTFDYHIQWRIQVDYQTSVTVYYTRDHSIYDPSIAVADDRFRFRVSPCTRELPGTDQQNQPRAMDKLELDIRKEIEELNTSVSLIDRLDDDGTLDDERQEQLLSSTRAVFENVNSSHAKNSLTDSQISIISKHDGYPDSGHFYATRRRRPSPPALTLGPQDVGNNPPTGTKRLTDAAQPDRRRELTSDSTSSKDTGPGDSTSCIDVRQKAAAAAAAANPKLAEQYSPNGGGGGGNSSLVSFLFPPGSPHLKKSHLPSTVVLGILQLLFSVALAALGGLVLARNASLAMAGTGLWCGAIAGIAGSLGLMNVKMAKTGFLAVNLICVASSTLGLALTGIGAVRDANLAQQDESFWYAVTAGSGLLIALALHFLVSVFSVYYSALKLCSR
ncbi:hypothetical protein quinque_015068 [Culex quinquefasciatus]